MFIPVPFLVALGLLIVILAALAVSRPPRRDDLVRPPATAQSALDGATLAQLRDMVRDGQKIDAIKLVRNRTGLGLKEAKEFVETL